MRKFKGVLLFWLVWFQVIATAGTDFGQGGNVVMCKSSPTNNLSGYYSLDYLLTLNTKKPLAHITSWQQSIYNIRRVINEKLPEFLARFDQFQQNILNEDYSRTEIWERIAFELIPINDQDLHSTVRVPSNCRNGNEIEIVQTVVRQYRDFSGVNKTIFKYVPEIFDSLNGDRPLQLSFLIIHEWLWSVSDNVDRNRRIVRFMHSPEFYSLSRKELIEQLNGMGLDVQAIPKIVAVDGSGDFTTLDEALAKSRINDVIQIKPGRYVTRGAVIDKPLELVGLGRTDDIVIEGSGFSPALVVQVKGGETALIHNLTFQRVTTDPFQTGYWEVLSIQSGNPVIRDCRFGDDEPGNTRTAIYVTGTAEPTVIKNYFQNIRKAILLSDSSGGIYRQNTYRGNVTDIGEYSRGKPVIDEAPGTIIRKRNKF